MAEADASLNAHVSDTSDISDHPHLDRAKIGRQLIIAAWGIEILAAFIGVLIAVLIIISTQQAIGETEQVRQGIASGIMSAFLGGLPFLMVAAVELTKIPLATACYHSRSRFWQAILVLGLIFLMVITFETILNGFERNFTQRTYIIKQKKKDLISTEEELAKIDRDIEVLAALTPDAVRKEFESGTEQIDKNRLNEIEEIDKQIHNARITYSGREAEALSKQIEQANNDIEKEEIEYREEIKRIEKDHGTQLGQSSESVLSKRKTLEKEAAAIRKELERLRNAEQKELTGVKETKQNTEELAKELRRIVVDFNEREERTKSTLETKIERLNKEISNLNDTLEKLIIKRDLTIEKEDEAQAFTLREDIVKRVTERYAPRINSLNKHSDGLRADLSGISVALAINDIQAKKDRALSDAKESFERQNTQGSRERETIRQKYVDERQPKERRLNIIPSILANLNKLSFGAELASKRDSQIKTLRADYAIRRTKLISHRDELANKLALALKSTEDSLLPVLERLQERRATIVERYETLRKSTQEKFVAGQKDLKQRESRISKMRIAGSGLGEKRLSLRDKIAEYAEDSQIYRVAALWTGKDSPADVTNDELRLISLIWFGSLAAIVAWTGTLLAFAGLAVQYGQRRTDSQLRRAWLAVLKAFRRLFVTWRHVKLKPREKVIEKEVVKTVEVVKEVPVDKVVFKEVPKEIVNRQLIYVPFFTDDPEHLAGQTTTERMKAERLGVGAKAKVESSHNSERQDDVGERSKAEEQGANESTTDDLFEKEGKEDSKKIEKEDKEDSKKTKKAD